MRFFVTEKLSARRSKTPEGFLLCEAVPIARTGIMIYGPGETPVAPAPDGLIYIERSPEEVFRDETIASFQGKPVTIEHPDNDVTPETWGKLAVGVCINPRRGEGDQEDLLLADLLITRPEAIKMIEGDQPEVSCGYDAEYTESGPGRGAQHDIIGNHVAIVEKGRCGYRCAIQDRDPFSKDQKMSKRTLAQRLRDAFKARDEAGMEEALSDMPAGGEVTAMTGDQPMAEGSGGGESHIHIHIPDTTKPAGNLPSTGETRIASDEVDPEAMPEGESEQPAEGRMKYTDEKLDAHFNEMRAMHDAMMESHAETRKMCDSMMERLNALGEENPEPAATGDEVNMGEGSAKEPMPKEIEGELEEEAPEGTGDAARKARDSQYLEESFSETVAMAEILAPGIRLPTFDKAMRPAKTLDSICKLRSAALKASYATADGAAILETLNGGKTVDVSRMSCGAVRTFFKAAAAMKRARNNDASRSGTSLDGAIIRPKSHVASIAELNRVNSDFYAKRK